MYTGLADPVTSPLDTIAYYDSVVKAMGGDGCDAGVLPLLPRARHGALRRRRGAEYVRRAGSARGLGRDEASRRTRFPASHSTNGQIDRTRPLCAYPAVARYKGAGSIDDAANFSCVVR